MDSLYDQFAFFSILGLLVAIYLWDVRSTVRRRHRALEDDARTPSPRPTTNA